MKKRLTGSTIPQHPSKLVRLVFTAYASDAGRWLLPMFIFCTNIVDGVGPVVLDTN